MTARTMPDNSGRGKSPPPSRCGPDVAKKAERTQNATKKAASKPKANAGQKRCRSDRTPLGAEPKVPKWMNKQSVKRELQASVKAIVSINLVVDQFNDDASAVSVSEALAVSKKAAPRSDEKVRWVYDGDDLNSDGEEEMVSRTENLTA